ncbi:alanine racemase [Mesorhizobium sp. CAU 1741]|uniref:alanine racemase n=1 Tax=Mesorhizobium sp. CAU 1741 TaxID=3140366 RepID=UPI00325B0C49
MAFEPDASHSGSDPRLAGGRLTVDLDALVHNYRALAGRSPSARVAGVVKGDGYGLGAAKVAGALWRAGCRTFFVALPAEGIALRAALPDAQIFVLNGLFGPEAVPAYGAHRLIPMLGSQGDISCWEAYGWDSDVPRPCAIHVDTGMNRLGLSLDEARSFAAENALTGAITPLLLISHLACGDAPDHPMNRQQLESFQAVRQIFPEIESSLSNSAGTFLGPDFAFDLVRPGIALYGGGAGPHSAGVVKPVATAEARVVQIRRAQTGDTVSYGGSQRLTRDTTIAVASVGYADGYHRSGSGAGVPLREAVANGGFGFLHGQRVPVLGRVTMDLTLFDVTDLAPGVLAQGDWIEVFGPNVPIDEAATAAGTIAYELLTSLGQRYHRRYVGGESSTE